MYPECSIELGKIVSFLLNNFPLDPWVQAWIEPEDAMERAQENGEKYPPEIPTGECLFGPFDPDPQARIAKVEAFANQELPATNTWKGSWRYNAFWRSMLAGHPLRNTGEDGESYWKVTLDMVHNFRFSNLLLLGLAIIVQEGHIQNAPVEIKADETWDVIRQTEGKGKGNVRLQPG